MYELFMLNTVESEYKYVTPKRFPACQPPATGNGPSI